MRKFEVVKDFAIKYGEKNVRMPERGTKYSAGYDFFSPTDAVIEPHSKLLISTNLKADMEGDEFLMLCPRSSMGKRGITLANGVGIIDKDFYGNESNDGNFGFLLQNNSDEPYVINKGDKLGQGIFMKFLTVENDIVASEVRSGGFGSTDKK